MTRDEIMKLKGWELDIVIAEKAMRWTCVMASDFSDDGYSFKLWTSPDGKSNNSVPSYSTDRNAAALVLAEIERRGKIKLFCDALWDMRGMDAALSVRDEMWVTITASPRDICRAALLAVHSDGDANG